VNPVGRAFSEAAGFRCFECKGSALCVSCEGEGKDERGVRCEDCAGSGECVRCFEARVNRDAGR